MSFLKNNEVKLLVLIHGWGSIILGLLVLFQLGTGTLSVFSWQVGEWGARADELKSHIAAPVDAKIQRALQDVPPEMRASSSVSVSTTQAGVLRVGVSSRTQTKAHNTIYEFNPDGTILRKQVDPKFSYPGDVREGDKRTYLREFLVNLHTRMGTRGGTTWGILLVAMVGLAMASAMISGVIVHWKHLVSGIFTLRKNAQPKVAKKDTHTVLGSWSLPFGFIWAFTGAYFGFYTWILFLFLPANGPPSRPLPKMPPIVQPVARANVDLVLSDAFKRTGIEAEQVNIVNRPGAPRRIYVTNLYDGQRARLQEGNLVYDGVDGHFIKENEKVPTSYKDLMYSVLMPIHFGFFGGLFSKIAVACLGVAFSILTISGIRLWVVAREAKEPYWVWFDRAASVVLYGQMLAYATATAGFFLSLPDQIVDAWTGWGFLIGALVATAVGVLAPRKWLADILRALAAAAMLALPLLRLNAGGPDWSSALATDRPVVVTGDLALVCIALVLLAKPVRTVMEGTGMLRPKPVHHNLDMIEEAAE